MERGYFIVSQVINNDDDYNKIIMYSNIYINIKYLHCVYEQNIHKELDNMISLID